MRTRGGAAIASAAVVALLAFAPSRSVESGAPVQRARSGPGGAVIAGTSALRPEEPSARAFGLALAGAERIPAVPAAGVRIVLVPHHWPAGHLALAALRDAQAPPGGWRRVVLLGPDHPNRGRTYATTSRASWHTSAGPVEPDPEGVGRLLAAGAADGGQLLRAEHGVSGVLAAVKWAMPAARAVPVAVRGRAAPGEALRLARVLAPIVDPETLVVVSVDFAHGVGTDAARRNDNETRAALAALDARRLLGWSDEHLDAREALAVALALARRIGAQRYVPLQRSDGSELPGYVGGPITSYMTGYYVAGKSLR